MAQDRTADMAHLERVVIDAFYLGHALAALGARRDYALSAPTRLVAEALLTWADMASRGLEGGAAVFLAEPEDSQKSLPPRDMEPQALSG